MNTPVIDVHCHLVAIGPNSGGFMSRQTRNNYAFRAMFLLYGYRRGKEAEFDRKIEETLVRKVRESETTDYAVALALDGVYDRSGRFDRERTHKYVPNDYVLDVVRRNKELLFGSSVSPDRADAIDELERVKEAGAVLVKWVPSSQDIDPSNKKYIPYYKKLAELKLPLLSHTGYEHCVPVTDQMYGDPQKLRTALDEGVTVIAAHAGCAGHFHPVEFFDDYVKLLDEYPNLYGDLAALCGTSRFGYAHRMPLIDGFCEKHLQATDYPVIPMPYLFAGRLKPCEIIRLSRIKNPFDCDTETKLALGFPKSIMTNAARVLNFQAKE